MVPSYNGILLVAVIVGSLLISVPTMAANTSIEAAGDLRINSIAANPSPLILNNGPNTTSFSVNMGGAAAPATNYTWLFGGKSYSTTVPVYTHTFTQPGAYTVVLLAENKSYPGGAQAQGYLNGGLVASVPIEGFFTWTQTGIPYQVQFNYTYNSSPYRGIPNKWFWSFYNSSGSLIDTEETSNAVFNYTFPFITDNFTCTYIVDVLASNTSGYVNNLSTTQNVNVNSPPLDIGANFTSVYNEPKCVSFPVFVNFKDNSKGSLSVDSQVWMFGDNFSTTETNPSHIYNKPGIYPITYSGTNQTYNQINNITRNIEVTGLYADFTMNPPGGMVIPGVGLNVDFASTSVGMPQYFLWDFGDNRPPEGPVTGATANHTYVRNGTYNVSLTVFKDCSGSQISNTSIKPIVITEWLVVDFSYYPNSGKYPLPVKFTDKSTDNPVYWQWWFYNQDGSLIKYIGGSNASSQNPSVVYPSPGTYKVTMNSVNNIGQTSEITKNIILYPGIIADFVADKTRGIFPFSVKFTDKSTPTQLVTNWSWDFGDSTTGSNDRNPTHTYTRKGNWTVSLTSWNAESQDMRQKSSYISVGTPITPDFTPNGTVPVRAPYYVNFTDLSTPANEVSGWAWFFGDGGIGSNREVSHQYPAPGQYNVSLKAKSYWDEKVVAYKITVKDVKEPVADFVASPLLLDAGESVTFEDRSTGPDLNSWLWDFDDEENSTLQYPKHVYKYAGQYYPSLTVGSPWGNDTKKAIDPISVRGPVIPSFKTDMLDWWAQINQPVTFIDSSYGHPITWTWDFDDGTSPATTNKPTIVHKYTRVGIYNITMTGTNWMGDTKTAFHMFEVADKHPPRDVNFEIPSMKYSGKMPLFVQFSDLTPPQSNVTEWFWEFGDGSNSFERAPNHTFIKPGEFSVTLTVRNDVGVNEKSKVAYVVVTNK